MAIFWLDYWREQERRRLSDPLFLMGCLLEAASAAAAAPPRPGARAAAALAALTGSALAGRALLPAVKWMEYQTAPPSAASLLDPPVSAPPGVELVELPSAGRTELPKWAQIDARRVALIGAAASPLICALIYLGRRPPPQMARHYGRFAEYRWRLAEPTTLTRLSAWGGYSLHQLAAWACIYVAQRQQPAYRDQMGALNWVAVGVNLGGIGLRYLQYRLHYDGLAQDVPEMTSLGSVTFMLVLILILEAPRRGLAFGNRELRLDREFVDFFRRYHGYIFSWSLIYTFWYHPLEPTAGHLMGIGYLLLYLVQSTLVFTRAHLDRRWTLLLELLVVIHAVAAALMNGGRYTPTFLFGFAGTALIAQVHSLRPPPQVVRALWLAYGLSAVVVMARRRELRRLHAIIHIPLLEYGLIGLLYAFYLLIRALPRRVPLLNSH